MPSEAHRTVAAVYRIESPKLIATLARYVRDVDLAEEIAQDALALALEKWPDAGVPENPGAWLMTVAKQRAIDVLRRARVGEKKYEAIALTAETFTELRDDEPNAGDDLLRLVLVACHPVLPREQQISLTLRLLCGLTTEEIARAFLVPEPTVQQRIVRAKKTLAEKKVPFEVPDDLAPRLASVIEVVYLVFNEGYSATSGDDWVRPELVGDALRLGRVLAALVPKESEVHALVALMEIQASRMRARVASNGDPVLLLDQDRTKWDELLVSRGLAALVRAEELATKPGPYLLQAAIAACHARARTADETDWARIAVLYAALSHITGSPIVELNRAVALGMAFGARAGLDVLDGIAKDPSLRDYHLLPSVRADFLAKLGRNAEARAELERAASLAKNAREKAMLLERAAKL